ncbi:MAG: hypothetical protein SOZ40_04185 [Ezakiella sp.]|nr:hypothetical protein [Ezakiella sp.]MDY3947172.1 hypothetical protein [Ezakiella sp.]
MSVEKGGIEMTILNEAVTIQEQAVEYADLMTPMCIDASCMGGCILHKRRTGRRNCSSIEHILGGYL